MNGQSAVGRLAQRLVVGLTRVGVNVRGARELSVRDKESGRPLQVLVFPVTVDGVEYLVSTRPEVPWACAKCVALNFATAVPDAT